MPSKVGEAPPTRHALKVGEARRRFAQRSLPL